MIFRVNITRQAEEDLRGIFEYIAYELHSFQNAVGQLGRLEEEIGSLERMPDRYRAYEREPWFSRGLRIMPVDNYLVFYIPCRDTQTVDVIRVLYGGRDLDTQLNQSTTNYKPCIWKAPVFGQVLFLWSTEKR